MYTVCFAVLTSTVLMRSTVTPSLRINDVKWSIVTLSGTMSPKVSGLGHFYSGLLFLLLPLVKPRRGTDAFTMHF